MHTKKGLLYCKNKSSSVIQATCDYIQGFFEESNERNNRKTQYELALEYHTSPKSITRHYSTILNIMKDEGISSPLFYP
jgi:hypothetical protein